MERDLADLLVGDVELEPVAESTQGLLVHLLLLVGDVLALAGLAHPVALDRLREDHGRPPGRALRRRVRGIDLPSVVAAAVERPDLLVAHVLDPLGELRVLAEELLAHERAAARLVRLVLPVDRLLHPAHQQAVLVGLQERIPAVAPDHLDHVPPGAAEDRLQDLDDLPVPVHRTVEALQVAVDDEHEVV